MRLARYAIVLLLLFVTVSLVARIEYPVPYRQTFVEQAQASGIDPRLALSVARAESHFRPAAVSVKGAVGVMQLMPATALFMANAMGQKTLPPGALTNPRTNIILGVRYLGYLKRLYGGNAILMIAAYNAGRGNVDRWLKTGQISGTASGIATVPFSETRFFVVRVLMNYGIYRILYPTL